VNRAGLGTGLLVAAAAWAGVAVVGRGMGAMSGTMGFSLVAFVAVWLLMMAAMMLPSVTPFAAVYARGFGERRASRMTAFVAGYLAVWAAAAFPVYEVARLAGRLDAEHPAGATALAVAVFAACGVYQLTPLKDRCLTWCRSPLGFTVRYSAYTGRTRDLRVGMHHGGFCLACCWALMALLLGFGLMNLAAMAFVAFIVFAERSWPWGPTAGRVVGVAALALAVAVIAFPGLAPALHGHTHSMPMTTTNGMS
jgi:predicted metal-binding membrane protein